MASTREEREKELVEVLLQDPSALVLRYRRAKGIPLQAALPVGKTAAVMIREILEIEFPKIASGVDGRQGERGD
jgi:hypothetical protein